METAPSPPRETRTDRWAALRRDATEPTAPPRDEGRLALVRYGLAQPFLGLRTIGRSADLLGIALAPAIAVALLGTVVGWSTAQEHGVWRGIAAGWVAIAALAPVPPLLFGRVYAHLAAKARPLLGLPPAGPYRRGLSQSVAEWLAQLVILAIGVLPFTALAGVMPLLGAALALLLNGVWALHWIVVEGYDNARTLPEGRTVEELEREGARRPGAPWFHRWHDSVHGPRWVVVLLSPVRMLSEVITTLAKPWRMEVDLVEERPWISLGYGLGVVVLLTVPGLNLLLRSATVVGGVHLRYRLLEAPQASASRPTTAPYPALPPG